ncbi:MAG: hypothetical protein ABI861_01580 [Panacibacter sp.]
MKKQLLFVLFIFAVCTAVNAQVRDSRTTIDTTVCSAVLIESDLSQGQAEEAIENYFDNMHVTKEKGKGFIIKKSLGYMLFKRAKVDSVNEAYDIYFVTENKKQKGKDASIIYIAISKGFNNFLSPEKDKQVWSELKNFATYMQANYFEQYKLYTHLADLSKDLEKKKKKLDDLLKEKYDLETSISAESAEIESLNEQLLKLKTSNQ